MLRGFAIVAAIGLLGLTVVLAGCGSHSGATSAGTISTGTATEKEKEKVSTMEGYVSSYHPAHLSSGEALEMVKLHSEAIILDVQSEGSYLERHVSAAVNVPYEKIADYAAANLPDKERVIICYCFCGDKGGAALSAYKLLTDMGYSRVFYMEPGDEWTYEGTAVAGEAGEKTAVAGGTGEKTEVTGGTGEDPAAGYTDADKPVYKTVTGEEAKKIYDADSACVLLDVRNPEEYAAGHIKGSVLIPVVELGLRLSELPPEKDTAIIVYCRSGRRSLMAHEILSAAGYTNLYDMKMVDSWPEPLVKL